MKTSCVPHLSSALVISGPQFDQQGNPSGARAANLPGPLNAHFWCVPGPFDMTLASGVWQIGQALAMNITQMVRDTDRYFLYDEVFDAVHAQGGLTGYAHVNSGLFHVHRDMSLNVPRQKVDFVEILQFSHLGTDLYYDFLNLGCKLTASAGSDVPWGGTIGEVRAYALFEK